MSYCVNCGVKLDASLSTCPLCDTPVINPNTIPSQTNPVSPYPQQKGKLEPVNRKDIFILSTSTLVAIAVCCGVLNVFFFSPILWSIPVIGLCALIWIFLLPFTLTPNLSKYLISFLDCLALGVYIYMITFLTPSNVWYFNVALPLVLLCFALLEFLLFLTKKIPFNFFAGLLYFIVATALICVTTELLLDTIFQVPFSLSWSAIVLAVCTILSCILITILSLRRIRYMLQKRFHI